MALKCRCEFWRNDFFVFVPSHTPHTEQTIDFDHWLNSNWMSCVHRAATRQHVVGCCWADDCFAAAWLKEMSWNGENICSSCRSSGYDMDIICCYYNTGIFTLLLLLLLLSLFSLATNKKTQIRQKKKQRKKSSCKNELYCTYELCLSPSFT